MRNHFLDEDVLFAVAVAVAIGFSAANLAIQLNKERAAFDAPAASQKLGRSTYPPPSASAAETHSNEPAELYSTIVSIKLPRLLPRRIHGTEAM
jgi:hypothetical protein